MKTFPARGLIALSAASVFALTACGSGGSNDAESPGGKVPVSAAFYPLQYAAERVGGDLVSVTGLTKPGTEPHDLELTPREVANLGKASLVIYEKGFQPAVDEAVANQAASTGFDVSSAANLSLTHADEEHSEESHSQEGDHAGHSHEGPDPHFWLDPHRYAGVVTAIAKELGAKDAKNAATYTRNAEAFVSELNALDADFKKVLATCQQKNLVTGHAAFGYLADRYGLQQESVSGISPDVEPNASALRAIVDHVRAEKVTTVYAETLVSPALTETLARETGAKVAILDPIEGVTSTSKGSNYLEIMRSNLETLKAGQQCR